MTEKHFPAGGPRQAVFDHLRSLGFTMESGLGDKNWISRDGIGVQVYGAGSMARITDKNDILMSAVECQMDDLAYRIDCIRRG